MQSSASQVFFAFVLIFHPTSGLRWPVAKKELHDHVPTVFYFVAMDLVAKSHFMKANVLSLRKHGQFKGPILFATDHAECLIHNLGQEILGDEIAKINESDVKVFAGPEKGMSIHIKDLSHNSKFDSPHRVKMGFEEHKALAKIYASTAHLPFETYNLVIIDDDIMIAKSLDQFINTISTVDVPLATFKEEGSSRGKEKYHCGLIVARPDADDCLRDWYEQLKKKFGDIQTLKDLSDWSFSGRGQQAFASAKCAKDGRIHLLNNHQLEFSYPTPTTLEESRVPTFVHFTNSYRMRKVLNHQQVQGFYNKVFTYDIDIGHGEDNEHCTYQTHTYSTYVR